MSKKDRRRFERHQIPLDLPVLNESDESRYIGIIKNISLNGLLIVGDTRLIEDKEFRIRILGDKPYGGRIETDFEVCVKCVWIEQIGTRFNSGCEFVSLPREILESVRQIIDSIDFDEI